MLKQIPDDAVADVNLVPRMVVGKPVSFLAERGHFKVHRGHDDLDFYEGATVTLGPTVYAFKWYRGNPADRTTVLMPLSIGSAEDIKSLLEQLRRELDLPTE